MKLTHTLVLYTTAFVSLVTKQSCVKIKGCTDVEAANYNKNALSDDGSCKYATTFYFDQSGPVATVNIATQSDSITTFYSNGDQPDCGLRARGCANFAFIPGDYYYRATSANNTWTGNIGVRSRCAVVLLQQGKTPVMFWTDNNNYGTITVNINGATNTISTFPIDPPPCGSTGCATFNLAPGSYNYIVNSAMYGQITTGIVTVTGDVCQTVEL